MIKAVIFDWSGVLCDDIEAVYNADMEVFKAVGLERVSIDEYKEIVELPWRDFYGKRGITDTKKIADVFHSAFSEKDSAKVMNGALETLQWLKEKGIKSAILSAKTKKYILNESKQFGFDELLAIIESWSDKRHSVKDLIQKLGVSKEEVLFVGDMVHDVNTAKHAEIKSIAVLSGYDAKDKLAKANPDYFIEDVGELPELIQKLNGELNA